MNMRGCWSFTYCLSWRLGSSSKYSQHKSIGSTLVDVHLNWLNWFHFLILEGDRLIILINCMIFLSSFLDVTRMSMSTVSFLEQLDPGILSVECFSLTFDLSGFESRINTAFNCRFFLNRFPVCFHLFGLLFLVAPCLVVAIQP